MALVLSSRLTRAFDYARVVHAADVRKQTAIPYLTHLLGVCTIVLEHGGNENQAIGALLHDAAEDHGGEARLADIEVEFGSAVAAIVRVCSDSLVDTNKTPKQDWWTRKVHYIAGLEAHEPDDQALLVSAADKLYNARAIVGDYRECNDDLWSRFNPAAGRGGALWYYSRLAEVLGAKLSANPTTKALADELTRTVADLHDLCRHHVGEDEVRRDAHIARERERLVLTEG